MGQFERPRRIVRPDASPGQQALTTGAGQRRITGAPGPAAPLRRERLTPRPQALREAVARLDAGLDENARRQLAEWIGQEYQASYGEIPLGLFARCYLGPPYVDHQLNLFEVILRHFTPGDQVPAPFADARTLVRSGGYAFVEVYTGGLLLPVLDDGTVVRP